MLSSPMGVPYFAVNAVRRVATNRSVASSWRRSSPAWLASVTNFGQVRHAFPLSHSCFGGAGPLEQLAKGGLYNARWRPDVLSVARILEITELSGGPVVCLLFNAGTLGADTKDPFVWTDGTECLPNSILLRATPDSEDSIRV